MRFVRRAHHVFFDLEDTYDVEFAGGKVAERIEPRIRALAVLTGERHALSREEFDELLSVPAARWVEAGPAHSDLVQKGLLLSDSDDAELRALRERDEGLSANAWNPYAALYHRMTRLQGVDIRAPGHEEAEIGPDFEAAGDAYVARYGPPPEPFPDPRDNGSLALPAGTRDGPLFRTLNARRTTRAFDRTRSMTAEDLGTVLRYVFGCHGYARAHANLVCIRRTSPSGGGLHPIEAYPIVRDVRGIAPGVYHYAADRHVLEPIESLDADTACRTSTAFMCGQSYFGDAHVTFVLAARFYRNHWKYREQPKAYAVILMDAAHLSQTLYLVCAELGLGAFVTAAINNRDIDDTLGFDAVSEGAVAMLGCGPRSDQPSRFEVSFSADLEAADGHDGQGTASSRRASRAASAATRMPLSP